MNRSHFIITGTSRGIGEQLARLLLESDSFVYGISRGNSDTLDSYKKYSHYPFDLSNIMGIESLMNGIFAQIDTDNADMICLINNAAMLEPLNAIDQCEVEEINQNLQISLVAPMILTSCFIKRSDNDQIRRKIINISSGSGTYPAPAMSVYCSAKAGINMFSQCVGLEQSMREHPIEIIAVDPGMVDTELQSVARGKNEREFVMAKYFDQAYQSGLLQSTESLGKQLLTIIEKKFAPGKLVKYSEA
ncbi:SDR family NAD(P)-dependent oxidoreductase [Cohnella faecalis]|uniref:SDR family NAD(P)-dependent oxidoreductase n=1 Tax=Cohnella faecalis TaxID=2315694 RepID=A0A398CU43_9BACL|nr:SDR family NAD(P)-dependent oxidoreductase [Cohnella faecalis]RIE03377.1 SDR family NAD(P)-dependent oxidoreductase [Cohnella faecalis]